MVSLILEYGFAQRALVTGLIVGLISPVIGLFIVARRLSVISEVLSQMSLSGIAFGSMLGSFVPFLQPVSPPLYGAVFAVIGAFFVEWLSKVYRDFSEVVIPILLSFGIGLSVLLFSMMDGFTVDFAGYLFGNLLAVSKWDVVLTAVVGAGVFITVALFYHPLLAMMFDREFSGVIGIRTQFVQVVFMIVMALTISVAVRAVGVLLVTGLMILPVASAMLLANGFKKTMAYSVMISEMSIVIGFVAAYYFQLASGGTIIVTAVFIFLAILVGKRAVFWFAVKS